MNKKLLSYFVFLLILSTGSPHASAANQAGDTLLLNGKRFKLLSNNLISNPGFESGFTGWTDATTAAATLTSAKFSIVASGGVNNSKYLVGLNNENSSSSGSIGTGWPIAAGKSYLMAYQVKYLTATTAAATETYLKVSLTNDKTSSAEPLVLINATQVGAGGAWTQNYITFTNSSSYSYVMARFRWLGNRLGFDDFMLYEAYELPNYEGLQQAINQAQTLYTVTGVGAADLQAAIATAQTAMSNTTPTIVAAAIVNLQKAIQTYQYANATPENPLDLSSFIVNRGFDDNTTTGWTGAGTVNYHEVEYYQKTFDMNQVISGLPAGKYRLRAKGFERPKGNDAGAAFRAGTETIYAKLYASTKNYSTVVTPFNSIYKHTFSGTGATNGYVNTMAGAEIMLTSTSPSYYDMTLSNILLNQGQTLTIGAKTDFQQTGYWVLFDQFRLEYLGAADVNDIALAIQNRVVEAQTLLTKRIQNTEAAGLNSAITQAQTAVAANPLVSADVNAAKTVMDAAIDAAYTSLTACKALNKAINDANLVLTFLEKADEITKLQNAIAAANVSYENKDLTVTQVNTASTTLKTITRSVGKQLYIASWSMGNVYDPTNNWYIERSKPSKNWILFWEPGFGEDPGTIVDDCLALAEKCFAFYADSLKFIKRGSSKTDTYKMVIRLRYSTDWEATGSGVDDKIGLLTLTPWAMTSRGGQTVAHEVGHCFQYQTHCDNNDQNGWMYGFASDASGSNGWWEQCAQWQAYKIFPTQQFTSEWFSAYLSNTHKNLMNETYRYNDYFIQDYWCDLHGMDMIGRLWNKSVKPEDPVETYKRLNVISQSVFNDEMWMCGAKFATWDIPALRSLGASAITSRTQPKLNNQGNYVWRIDSTVCLENYGHNIIRLNAPSTAKTVTVNFEGLAGANGYRKNYVTYAGWRYGFVALLVDGTRVYSQAKAASMSDNAGKGSLSFDCPANCSKLWLVVSGAPSLHWRHAWDDNDANDEQWPYQVNFLNTNVYGYINVGVQPVQESKISAYSAEGRLYVNDLPAEATIQITSVAGLILCREQTSESCFNMRLPAGMYLVTVETKSGRVNQKVLVK